MALQAMEAADTEKYQCTGSLDPQIVRQSFNRLLPTWQFVDLTESNRLEDARVNVGYCDSAPTLVVQRLRSQWPVVKSPIQQSLILPEQPIIVADQGKVAPIAMDPNRESRFGQDLGQIGDESFGDIGKLWHARNPSEFTLSPVDSEAGWISVRADRPATAQSVSAATPQQPVRNLLTERICDATIFAG